MKNLFFCFLIILLAGCTPTLKLLSGVRNPKIRSDEKANELFVKLPVQPKVIDTHFLELKDKQQQLLNLFKGATSAAHVYNKQGELLCYQGDEFCDAVILDQVKEQSIDEVYKLCVSDSLDMLSAPFNLEDLVNNTTLKKEDISSDYVVVFFWSYDLARRDHTYNWQGVYDSFKDKKEDITYIRVNTDLRSSWGLPEGKKGKIKFKLLKDREVDMTLTIPYYDTNNSKELDD